jgi:DNA-binding LacI/PurR family transcriptional regulator
VYEYLRWVPGEQDRMAVTITDVARSAGVSRSAVSRTFTDGASVSAKTRAKVEKAARDLGYRPSLIARSLATKRTKLIGLVANNFQNPAFLQIFDYFTEELQARGFRPLLVNLTNETSPEKSLQLLRQYSVDGVIVATSTLPPNFAGTFRKAGMPVVHSLGKHQSSNEVHVVGIDNVRCGELAAETLYERGYAMVGMIGGPELATSTQDRVSGFLRRAKQLGLNVARTCYAENYTYSAGAEAMQKLRTAPPVEAVFCGDDLICMGAMDFARTSGLKIPSDIGFIGVNDINMAGWSAYNLTTIRQPFRDIIQSSIELIVDLVDNPDRVVESRLFACTVTERGSLKPKQRSIP